MVIGHLGRPGRLALGVLLFVTMPGCTTTPQPLPTATGSIVPAPAGPLVTPPVPTAPPATPTLPPTSSATASIVPTSPPPTSPPPSSVSPSPSAPAAVLRIAAQDAIEVPDGAILRPSPDGLLLARLSQDGRLCIHRLPTGVELRCGAFPEGHKGHIDPRTVRWSPDSTRLAFTENLFVFAEESDIWTMDAATGTFTDLTNDDVSGSILQVAGDVEFDVIPAWSPDSLRIVFARTPKDRTRTELVTIAADGTGTEASLGSIGDTAFPVYYGTRWLTGERIIYSTVLEGGPRLAGGIFSLDTSGNGAPMQLAGRDEQRGPPDVADAALDGRVIVVVYEQVRRRATGSAGAYALLWADDARIEHLEPPALAAPGSFVVSAAVSADGTMLAYAYRADGRYQLAIRHLASESDQLLGDPQAPPFAAVNDATAIAWLAQDRLWVGLTRESGTLYTLTSGSP